ncbi:hypothetical protein KEM52_003558 [Ascosphaera acerosa]|nr:hypothetical protein KEM52_003558 [Ascosphaera acerosa]
MSDKQQQLLEPAYIQFPLLPADARNADGSLRLNRVSATITAGHDFPAAQVGQHSEPKRCGR